MKKTKIVLLASLALLTLAACGKAGSSASQSTKKTGNTINIGVNLELSGAVSAYGNQEKEGLELAAEQINKAGGVLGKKIKLVIKDNKSETAEAAKVAANLTTNDNVVAIVGPATSNASKAVIPNITRAEVPTVTPSGTDDSITVNNKKVQPYIFRATFQDSFQGVILAKYATDSLKAKKAIIIGDNSSDYAKGLTKSFKNSYKGKVVEEEHFSSGDKDFQSILTKIKNKDFDVLYVPGYYTEAGLIIKQAREMGITQPILGADGFGDAKLVETADAKNVNNVFYTSSFSTNATSNEKVTEFTKAFEAKYKTTPSSFHALAYDSLYMIAEALEKAKSVDSQKVTDQLAKLKNFQGVTGEMTIDKDHNPEKEAVIIGLTNGKETSAEVVKP